MNQPDVLARAAKALRAAHSGENQGSGFTRARLMVSLHRNRRGRLMRWALGAPLASVLLVGSAWAQSAGKWPVVWAAVTSVFVSAPAPSEAPSKTSARPAERTKTKMELQREAETPAPVEPPAPPAVQELTPPDAPLPSVDPQAIEPKSRQRPTAQPSSVRPQAPRATESAPEPRRSASAETTVEPARVERAADPELARFRQAHELHFQSDRPREAIAAYAAYLQAFPSGRFVPEARYNTALNYIKLGDKERARQELRPFANGRYGDYRKREAAQLLDAMK